MKKMMDAAELDRMLGELDEELKYTGASAMVYVFGGARGEGQSSDEMAKDDHQHKA